MSNREIKIQQLRESIRELKKIIEKYEGDCPPHMEDHYKAKAARYRESLYRLESELDQLLSPGRPLEPPPPPPKKPGCLERIIEGFASLLGCAILIAIALAIIAIIDKLH